MILKKNSTTVGIDYSMSSPSICVHVGKSWDIKNCKFYYLTDKQKFILANSQFSSIKHEEYTCSEFRFDFISNWAISVIPKKAKVFLEGYSFSSKGVVFNIGECCGLLKYKLWKSKINYISIPPTTIKKYATGKGTANKIDMYNFFIDETKFDIHTHIDCKIGNSPLSDIIDSYYIAKWGHFSQIAIL